MKKFIAVAAITLAALASSAVNAAMVVYAPTNPFSFTASAGTLTFDYLSGTTVSQIAAGDDNPAPPIANQSYDAISDAIETVFGLPANTFASETDVSNGGSSTYKGDINGSSATIYSDIAYDYLAIHFGQYEVFFHFAALVQPGEAFRIFKVAAQGQGGGLSNYRAYNSNPSVIPIPAAAFLFAPALLGFLGLRRKAKNTLA